MSDNWQPKKKKRKTLKGYKKSVLVSLAAAPWVKEHLIALSYLEGDRGKYARVTRRILQRGIRSYIAEDLTPEEKTEFENILENVKTEELVSGMKRQERERQDRLAAGRPATIMEDIIMAMDDPNVED